MDFKGWYIELRWVEAGKKLSVSDIRQQKTNQTGWNLLFILEVLSFLRQDSLSSPELFWLFACLQDNHRYTLVLQLVLF